MAYFALLDPNDRVTQVIVAEQDFIDSLPNKDRYVQTCKETRGCVHQKGGTPLRGNWAFGGCVYDRVSDVFIEPQPYPSWKLNRTNFLWEPPIPRPSDCEFCTWSEDARGWVNLISPEFHAGMEAAKAVLDV